jgi:fatty acid synthase subunit beta, fungi type
MADALVPLLLSEARARAAQAPFVADLTGGLDALTNLAEVLGELRVREETKQRTEKRRAALEDAFARALKRVAPRAVTPVSPLARQRALVPVPSDAELSRLSALDHLDLDEVFVIVGAGEVSPYGSARTRWAVERGATLSIEAVLELAWMMGLVVPDEKGSGFLDAKTQQRVSEEEALARYEQDVLTHTGVRVIEPAVTGFDPRALPRLVEVRLEKDFSFPAPSREVADAIVREDPEHTVLVTDQGGALRVVRRRGATLQVPASLSAHRHVAGQIPTGWDATRFGIPKELAEQVDPVTLYCLISTAEAFLSAGLSPEELYAHLHPGRVGVTIGTGIGGMTKLKRLHRDFFEGHERQNDTLQETLINVIGGYVVQAFLGSYGPMSFPVGACATAGLSIADAVEKLKTGAADLVVAGGADDLSEAGLLGFGDMGATADTEELAARGVDARHMSRPNDSRRRGFVESQGAGVSVVCRASLAVKLGLPVHGIVAFAGSSGDGLQKSVPAPGQGALALAGERRASATDGTACDLTGRRAQIAAFEAQRGALAASFGTDAAAAIIKDARKRLGHSFWVGREDISPLRGALAVLGLEADDVGVVSKHDSSTQANDLNEAKLHETIMQALGRSEDAPLWVISQKSLTGHPKGAAAAWQMNGLMQAMAEGVIPGNASLDDVDDDMAQFPHLVWTDRPVQVSWHALKAGFVTTLGFGHVSALVCLAHPFLFWRMLDDGTRDAYRSRLAERMRATEQRLQRVLSGREPLVRIRPPQLLPDAERAMLLDAGARMAGHA